ncbi:hypothetical protein LUW77_16680 [Streptomyces radiopugnans]|nr:hypothetical protein LUW77_16680 [Streptomyces radiopugnans]
MTVRSRMRFVHWSLSIDPDGGAPAYEAACTACDAASGPSVDKRAPELWCLRHAGRTGHTGFRATITSLFRATPLEGPRPP